MNQDRARVYCIVNFFLGEPLLLFLTLLTVDPWRILPISLPSEVLALIGDLHPTDTVIKSLVLTPRWAHQYFGHHLRRQSGSDPSTATMTPTSQSWQTSSQKNITALFN